MLLPVVQSKTGGKVLEDLIRQPKHFIATQQLTLLMTNYALGAYIDQIGTNIGNETKAASLQIGAYIVYDALWKSALEKKVVLPYVSRETIQSFLPSLHEEPEWKAEEGKLRDLYLQKIRKENPTITNILKYVVRNHPDQEESEYIFFGGAITYFLLTRQAEADELKKGFVE